MAKSTEHHRLWSDDLSLTDIEVLNHGELLGPKQIADRYPLALAVRNSGRFVTFDKGIRATGVMGATKEHLIQLFG
jgi:hypothetical protein